MASPFKALSPFAPRSIELNYEAFAPACPPEPSPEAQLVVGDYLSDICGTNTDLGVLVGGSVHVINDILHSVGTLSLVIGTVVFSGDPGVIILDDPSGNIVPSGQDTGLEFQFTVPIDPGDYAIFILIPSNDPASPCTYGYTFSVATPPVDPITYQWQWYQQSDNTWHDISGETNSTLTIDNTLPPDGYLENPPPYNSFEYRCIVSCPTGVTITAYYNDILFWTTQNEPLNFPWSVTAVNDPLGATSVISHTMIISSDT